MIEQFISQSNYLKSHIIIHVLWTDKSDYSGAYTYQTQLTEMVTQPPPMHLQIQIPYGIYEATGKIQPVLLLSVFIIGRGQEWHIDQTDVLPLCIRMTAMYC